MTVKYTSKNGMNRYTHPFSQWKKELLFILNRNFKIPYSNS